MVLGLADQTVTLWSIALGAGLAVLALVAVLLYVLLRSVQQVDESVKGVWEAGKSVAANTATTWMLNETASRLERLADHLAATGRRSRRSSHRRR